MNEIQHLTGIYHEKQYGALCAQHALNNLLQKEFFTAVSLGDIARELDDDENFFLSTTNSYRQKPSKVRESENMDDTGYFSIQVLQRALKIVDIELISYNSQQRIAEQARQTPTNIQGYICNLHQHWLTIRRFGSQYFDLNSMLTVPILISNTYLSLYLAQLQLNGYSIFIVNGVLPVCVADERLSRSPVDPKRYNQLTKRLNNSKVVIQTSSSHKLTSSMFDNDDDNLTRAIEASIQHNNVQDKILQEALEKSFFDSQKGNIQNNELTNQLLLEEAIAASLNNVSLTSQKQQEQLTVDALRSKRLQYYENKE